MKKLLIALLVFVIAGPLQAQIVGKVATKVPKKALTAPVKNLPSYGGSHRAIMGVDYHLTSAVAGASASSAVSSQVTRSWLTQQQRNLKAWKLKNERIERDIQAKQKNLLMEEITRQKAALPKLQPENAFETATFSQLITSTRPTQQVPLVVEPGVLYRGLALNSDGAAIKNILENGLQIADVGTEANTRNLAMSGGIPGVVRATRPHTNLTSFPNDAVNWAKLRAGNMEDKLIIIVKVEKQTREAGKVVAVYEDIPPQQISQIIAPLNVNGEATWCQISLGQDGTFVITPYETHITDTY